jgi:hypothetical protein
VKLDRPGLKGGGTDMLVVPVAALTENFSPIPRIAPPPFGKVTRGRKSARSVSLVDSKRRFRLRGEAREQGHRLLHPVDAALESFPWDRASVHLLASLSPTSQV